jgi:hypothetical protein
MNPQTRQKGVIPLAIIAVAFLVTSLVGVVVTTNDEEGNFSLSSWAKAKPKTWQDIGNPKARQAAKDAADADTAQAQAVQQVCPGGCTATQLQNAGIQVTAGQNPSGFYYNAQSGSYYPIAASAGGGYGAAELQNIGAAQSGTADPSGSTNDDAEQADTQDLSNPQLQNPEHYGDESETAAQAGSGTSGQTTISGTGSAGAGSSDVNTYGGDINTLFGQTNFGLTQSGDEINLGAVIDPIFGPTTNIGVNVNDEQVSVGVQNPALDTAADVAQAGAITTAQVAFAPAINAYNSAVQTYNAYVTFNNIMNTVEAVGAGISNILGNIFGQ